jgi:hypothetical protein
MLSGSRRSIRVGKFAPGVIFRARRAPARDRPNRRAPDDYNLPITPDVPTGTCASDGLLPRLQPG